MPLSMLFTKDGDLAGGMAMLRRALLASQLLTEKSGVQALKGRGRQLEMLLAEDNPAALLACGMAGVLSGLVDAPPDKVVEVLTQLAEVKGLIEESPAPTPRTLADILVRLTE